MGDAAVRQVLGSDALVGLLEVLMGDQVVAFDHKWFRFVLPGGQTPFHMDSVFFGRSRRAGPLDAAGLHTVWLPWNDLPPEAGGLLLLEGSHRLPGFQRYRQVASSPRCFRACLIYCAATWLCPPLRLIQTYGTQFDTCGSDIDSPYVSSNAAHLSSFDPQARWVSGRGSGNTGSDGFLYRAGDVVLFTRFTIHGSLENQSNDYVRLSTDVRFQPASDPIDYRHTATPGRKMTDPSQDKEYMREMHARFDRIKANTHQGPKRTMSEALSDWGVAPKAAL